MKRPNTILLTGASGLVGRHLLEELKNDYRIFAVARRSQQECGAPVHPNIAWIRADIADYYGIGQAFREAATAGGADIVIHLAAFYDFTSTKHPEYYRTNVGGTRNVVTLASELAPRLFVFASSVAACSFPQAGSTVSEDSPPDGDHVYSWSKREGEKLILDDKNTMRSCIVRLGAVFTDWCEYAPLYMFLKTWLGASWKARVLAGKGESAVPYIHIRDIVGCMRNIIEKTDTLPTKCIVHASTPGATSHKRLFQLATKYYYGEAKRPIHMPVVFARFGLSMMHLMARVFRTEVPFERPWMLRYIDECLDVSMDKTRELLNWAPKPRHYIERRIPYMIERLKSEPIIWHLRNVRAMMRDPERPEFRLYMVLSMLEYSICDEIVETVHSDAAAETFAVMSKAPREETLWYARLLYRLLVSSIHGGNKLLLQNYFEMTVEGKSRSATPVMESVAFLELLNRLVHEAARTNAELRSLGTELQHSVSLPIEFAIDELISLEEAASEAPTQVVETHEEVLDDERLRARAQLEETIWGCLVTRKWDEL